MLSQRDPEEGIKTVNQERKKHTVARAALDFIEEGMIIGVGTGTTVDIFIEELKNSKSRIEGAVASSINTHEKLKERGIPILELNATGELELYVDGADEATKHLHLLKGGGGALTREKIIAQASRKFVCVIDDSKLVDRLGRFPLPIEVIPMARSAVAREIVKIGGTPEWRSDYRTDNGNTIIDVHHLEINEPSALETLLNQIPGVVTNGIFAKRAADILLVATSSGVESYT